MSGTSSVTLPLTAAQSGMWLAQLVDPANPMYAIAECIDISGPLDAVLFERAVAVAVGECEALRVRFVRVGEEVRQTVGPVPEQPLQFVDLTGADDPVAAAAEWVHREAHTPFDLTGAALYTFALLRVGEQEHTWFLRPHHAIVDGFSGSLFTHRVSAVYGALVAGEPVPPADFGTVAELVAAETEYRSSERFTDDRAYWTERFADRPVPVTLAGRPPQVPAAHQRVAGRVAADAAQALGDLAKQVRTAWPNAVFAGIAGYLHRVTGSRDVILGLAVSARQDVAARRTPGMVSNAIPLRVRIEPGMTVAELVRAVGTEVRTALGHQRYRYEDLHRDLGMVGHRGRLWGPEINLVLYDYKLDFAGCPATVRSMSIGPEEDLSLVVDGRGLATGFGIDFHANSALYQADDVADHRDRLLRYLAGMVSAGPDGLLDGIEVLTPAERAVVPVESGVPVQVLTPAGAVALPGMTGELHVDGVAQGRLAAWLLDGTVEPRAALAEVVETPKARSDRARTPREEILCGLFAELVGAPTVGVEESFFDLGGHSLSAIRLLSRIRSLFGVELGIRQVFESPTPAALAALLDQADGARLALRPWERPELIPLSFAQRRLWFINRLEGPNARYNHGLSLRLSGSLDRAALAAALSDVVGRHESLRTVFPEIDGTPWQRVLDPAAVDLPVVAATEDRLSELVETQALRGFALDSDLPLRATLFALGETEHVLLVVVHHISSDGWSLVPMAKDLSSAYAARLRGMAPDWAPLPVQYADYTLWQHELLGSEDDPDSLGSRQLAFWERTLAGLPDSLTLPADRPRPARLSPHGGQARFVIPAGLHADLAALARDSRASLFMVLQAAIAATLTRLGAGTDIPLGTPVAGRTDEALDDLVGFFVNTVVLRTDTSGDPTFAELVERVREADLAAHANQDIPFERLVEALNPRRSLSRHPLFQVMLSLQNAPTGSLDVEGLSVSPHEIEAAVAKFDLEFLLEEGQAGIDGILEYSTDLFDPSTASAMVARLLSVLAQVAESPSTPVEALDVLLPGESPEMPEPVAPSTFPALFAAQVAATPDAPALITAAGTMTYRELDTHTDAMAATLIENGLRVESILQVDSDPVPTTVAALKAGITVQLPAGPLSATPNAARAGTAPQTSTASQASTAPRAGSPHPPPGGQPCSSISASPGREDQDRANVDNSFHCGQLPTVRPDNAAFVVAALNTADSSANSARAGGVHADNALVGPQGMHMGTVLTHAGIAAVVAEETAATGLGPGRTLGLAGSTGAEAARRICVALLSGAALTDGDGDHLIIGTADLAAMSQAALDAAAAITVADQPVPVTLAKRATTLTHTTGSPAALGPVLRWTGPAPDQHDRLPAGKPTMGARLLDDRLRPVPPGVTGHLYLPTTARGHLTAADTAQRFLADAHGARMYRTDLRARWTADGELRLDSPTPDPIRTESALRAFPGVLDATVHDTIAYIVGDIDPIAAKEFLRDLLPADEVPAEIVIRTALPTTAAERTAPDTTASASTAELQKLFAEVLGADVVGEHDSFFQVGGHSLSAIKLLSRIRSLFGVELGIRQVFESPTPAALAELVDRAETARPALRARPRPDLVPLSFAQRRLWFIDQLDGPSATYNHGMSLRLAGELDRTALTTALGDVVARHESLRTIFPTENGTPRQHITTLSTVDLKTVDATEADLDDLVIAQARTGFALDTERPIRATLFVLGPTEHVLLVVVHHIASDGWSLAPLGRDLSTAYAARRRGTVPDWAPLPVQYADYALWQHELLGDEDDPTSLLSRQVEFWATTLADLPDELTLPTDRPRPTEISHRGGTVPIEIDPDLHHRLATVATAGGASLFMVLQAGIAALLAALGAGTDIPLGTPVAGRTDDALDDLVGFFVNTVVLRTDTSGAPSFTELVTRVREADLAAHANQDVPFERLVEVLNPVRSLARHPLFQVVVTLQTGQDPTMHLPGLDVRPHEIEVGVAKFDLEFLLREHDAGIGGVLQYSTDLFDHATVTALVTRLVRLLDQAADTPGKPITEIDILDQVERRQVLTDWNDTAFDDGATTITELFAARVNATPDAPAVIDGDSTLTYADLDRATNRLADLLTQRGAGPERVVALVLPRSTALITGAVATLKTGAAYLPIDADLPAERIAFMLATAEPVAVLTLDRHRAVAGADPLALDDRAVLADLATRPDSAPVLVPDPRTPAYVIFTSGSTGVPKGVVVTHRGLASFIAAQAERFDITSDSKVLQFASPSFDASVLELCMALPLGAALVVPPPGPLAGEPLAEVLADNRITHALIPPAALASVPPVDLPEFRSLVVGGDASSADLVDRWAPGRRMVNAYGPTESTVVTSTSAPLTEGSGTPPIGSPIHNTTVHVLDGALRPVPPGVPGELYIGGAGLARGYLGRPALTAERFVAAPFGPQGARLFRSGDLVRWSADGELHYLGRTDHQVKIRGFRIELGEIEAVIGRQPGVTAVAVLVREDEPGRKQLVAYLVSDQPVEVIREGITAYLPDYMVPTAFVPLDRLPLTSSGKLDRAALPAPERQSQGRAPAGTREELLCELFADVLGVASVGPDDGFFALGGDSIVSIQLVGRARAAGLLFTAKDVFTHKTAAGLAAVATEVTAAVTEPPDAGIGDLPPTPVMHWLRELGGPFGRFTQTALVQTPTDATADDLATVLLALSDHHDMLRMTLTTDPQWTVTVGPRGRRPALRRVDVAGLAEDELRTVVAAEAETTWDGLDPISDGVLRTVWFDAGPGHPGQLLIAVHHLAIDGISWRVLLPDLAAAWQAHRTGLPITLPPVGTSFRTWATALTTAATDPARTAELPLWRGILDQPDRPLGDRRLDRTRDLVATSGTLTVELPPDRTAALLTTVPEALTAGINDVLLTALAMAVADWRRRTGRGTGTGVLVDLESHGREDVLPGLDIGRTVGWFTGIHPVRLDPKVHDRAAWWAGGPVVGQSLRRVKEQLRAVPDNGIGYGLLRHLNADTAAVLAPLPTPQFGFNYLGRLDLVADADTRDWDLVRHADDVSGGNDPHAPLAHLIDLNALVRPSEAGAVLAGTWSWAGEVLAHNDIHDLALTWFRALDVLIDHAARPDVGGYSPSDLPLLSMSQDEIDLLQTEWRTLR